jgi:hypothetical protein
MGMHIGLVAVKAPVAQFRAAFSRTWTKFEIVAVAETLQDANAMWAWKESHEQVVSAADWSEENPGKEVYVFWQDGAWGVMMDSSYTLASDEEALKDLSTQLGTVVSFIVETAGGCADFWCFVNGSLRRNICNDGTAVSTQGEPLPEEAGIDVSHYYMEESEALWKALGLSPYEQMPTSVSCQALCVVDRTDYNKVVPARPTPALKKPWWKFW